MNKYRINLNFILLIISLCALMWSLKYIFIGFNTFGSGDNLTYASLARNIVENFKIAHISALPSDIYLGNLFPKYDISQNIGLPLYMVPFFKIFGSNNFSISISSLCLYIFNSLFIFKIGMKVFNSKVAILATFLFIFSPSYYQYIETGLTEPLLTFLFLSILYISLFCESKYKGLLTSIILFMIYLTKSAMAIFIFPYFIFHWIFFEKRKLDYISGILLFPALILLYKFSLTFVNPENYSQKDSLMDLLFNRDEDRSKWYYGLRSLTLPEEWNSPAKFIKNNFVSLLKNYIENVYNFYLVLFSPLFLFIGTLFIPLFFYKRIFTQIQLTFIYFAFINLILMIFGFAIGWPLARYLVPIIPLFIILVSKSLILFFETKNKAYFFITIFLIQLATPMFLVRDIYFKDHTNYDDVGKFISDNTKPNNIIVSNAPVLVGWYSNRRSILFPNNIYDLAALKKANSNIDAVVLTKEINYLFQNSILNDDWIRAYKKEIPDLIETYCLKNKYQKNNYKVLLYKECL